MVKQRLPPGSKAVSVIAPGVKESQFQQDHNLHWFIHWLWLKHQAFVLATCIRPRTMFGALEALNVPSPQNSKLHYQAWWQTDLSVSCFWFKDQSFWFFFNWEKNHDDDAVTSLQPRPPRRALRTLLATISELPHSQSSWLEPWESRVACLGLHGTLFNLLFEHHHHQHQHNL